MGRSRKPYLRSEKRAKRSRSSSAKRVKKAASGSDLNAGTCPICLRLWMVITQGTNKGRLVNHGYQRPPWGGEQTKGCFGEKALPYEKSTEALTQYLDHLRPILKGYRATLKRLQERPEKIGDRRAAGRPPYPQIDQSHPNYEYSLEREVGETQMYAGQVEREIEQVERRIEKWPGEQPLKHKEPADKQSLTDRLVVGASYRLGNKTVKLLGKGLEMGGFRTTYDGALIEFENGKQLKVRARQLGPIE